MLKSFLQLLVQMLILVINTKRIKKKSVSRYTMKLKSPREKKVLKVDRKGKKIFQVVAIRLMATFFTINDEAVKLYHNMLRKCQSGIP